MPSFCPLCQSSEDQQTKALGEALKGLAFKSRRAEVFQYGLHKLHRLRLTEDLGQHEI